MTSVAGALTGVAAVFIAGIGGAGAIVAQDVNDHQGGDWSTTDTINTIGLAIGVAVIPFSPVAGLIILAFAGAAYDAGY